VFRLGGHERRHDVGIGLKVVRKAAIEDWKHGQKLEAQRFVVPESSRDTTPLAARAHVLFRLRETDELPERFSIGNPAKQCLTHKTRIDYQ